MHFSEHILRRAAATSEVGRWVGGWIDGCNAGVKPAQVILVFANGSFAQKSIINKKKKCKKFTLIER